MTLRRLGVLLLALGLSAGCGSAMDRGHSVPMQEIAEPVSQRDWAPVVVVRDQDDRLRLRPYTFCWVPAGGCADGIPSRPLPDLGLATGSPVVVSFRMDGWRFSASQYRVGNPDRSHGVRMVQVDDHTWRMRPTGEPGRYQVDIFGRGPQGDLLVSFAVRIMRADCGATAAG